MAFPWLLLSSLAGTGLMAANQPNQQPFRDTDLEQMIRESIIKRARGEVPTMSPADVTKWQGVMEQMYGPTQQMEERNVREQIAQNYADMGRYFSGGNLGAQREAMQQLATQYGAQKMQGALGLAQSDLQSRIAAESQFLPSALNYYGLMQNIQSQYNKPSVWEQMFGPALSYGIGRGMGDLFSPATPAVPGDMSDSDATRRAARNQF